jgi:hypothetical protein
MDGFGGDAREGFQRKVGVLFLDGLLGSGIVGELGRGTLGCL